MPTYSYKCQSCGADIEIFQNMTDDPIKKCPECSENSLKRLIGSGAGIIFKGSGFYTTDYRSDSYKSAAKSDTSSSADSSSSESSSSKDTSTASKEPAAKS